MWEFLAVWMKSAEKYLPAIIVGLFSGFCRFLQGDVTEKDSERSIWQRFLKQLSASLFAALVTWLATSSMPISEELRIALSMIASWSAVKVIGIIDDKMAVRLAKRLGDTVIGKNDGDDDEDV